MLDSTTKTTTAKPASSSKLDATQAFRATAENGTAQAKEAFAKMSAAAAEATSVIKNSYSTAVEGAQDYNSKVIEFANANTDVLKLVLNFHTNHMEYFITIYMIFSIIGVDGVDIQNI